MFNVSHTLKLHWQTRAAMQASNWGVGGSSPEVRFRKSGSGSEVAQASAVPVTRRLHRAVALLRIPGHAEPGSSSHAEHRYLLLIESNKIFTNSTESAVAKILCSHSTVFSFRGAAVVTTAVREANLLDFGIHQTKLGFNEGFFELNSPRSDEK